MVKETNKLNWHLYVFSVAFAIYWASNLILWFPWSYSSALGITLMLTVNPVLWGWAVFVSLKQAPHKNRMKNALAVSVIMLIVAVVFDYLFFGLIRNATEELYHPTTFYGYGFVLILPFVISLIFKNKILQKQTPLHLKDYFWPLFIGSVCLFLLAIIILFGTDV
jgi:hypothetical protein